MTGFLAFCGSALVILFIAGHIAGQIKDHVATEIKIVADQIKEKQRIAAIAEHDRQIVELERAQASLRNLLRRCQEGSIDEATLWQTMQDAHPEAWAMILAHQEEQLRTRH